jgi:hypothetical protein
MSNSETDSTTDTKFAIKLELAEPQNFSNSRAFAFPLAFQNANFRPSLDSNRHSPLFNKRQNAKARTPDWGESDHKWTSF